MLTPITDYLKTSGFQIFKYVVYVLLSFNVYLFFREEWLASQTIFASGVDFSVLIKAFGATIDTAAWVILLLIFELETYVLDDEKIKGWLKWSLDIVRSLCYLVIVYAFYGYVSKYLLLSGFEPVHLSQVCTMPSDWKFMITLNEYIEISKQTCETYATGPYFELTSKQIITNAAVLSDTKMLAVVDMINSAAWLLVCVVLEIDVRIELAMAQSHFKNQMPAWARYNLYAKQLAYGSLLLAAIYWGFKGSFMDFWDAFLWLLAFVLIELNVFEWQAENVEQKQNLNLAQVTH